ncbi:MAG: 4-hydroxythreonine-4-phosphate dehydrogenase PdxA, partial [Gemmatimonadota bacterium]|nr:4-hydroxythreonine-4-phosphate dehydrogenase PdxA [Gemmatimonadota bacterium]
MTNKPRIGITLGDPRGIGPEVSAAALAARPDLDVDVRIVGPTGLAAAETALEGVGSWDTIGDWDP